MVALLGPSGCGKTTTLRMIAGLVAPSAGEIFLDDRPITGIPAHRRNIGMLFQNYALFPHMNVAENVAFGLEARGMRRDGQGGAGRRGAADGAARRLWRQRMPAQLSGGQQQRVALARALVIQPALLLLDEPLGALDKSLRQEMQVELRGLQRRLGITTVMVTHDQDEALTMADRIAIMRDGVLEQSRIARRRSISARPRALSRAFSVLRIFSRSGRSRGGGVGRMSPRPAGSRSRCRSRARSAARSPSPCGRRR